MPNTYTMTAEIWTANEEDPDHSDNKASVTFTPASADPPTTSKKTAALSIIKPQLAQVQPVGQPSTLQWGVKNAGPDPATGVLVYLPITPGLTFVRANASRGTYTSTNGKWAVGEVAAGTTETLDLTVQP